MDRTSAAAGTVGLALSRNNLTAIGLGVIAVLVVGGFLVGLLITAVVARLVIALVVIGAAVLVWHQRSTLLDDLSTKKCNLSATFFGVHIDPPASVRHACRRIERGVRHHTG